MFCFRKILFFIFATFLVYFCMAMNYELWQCGFPKMLVWFTKNRHFHITIKRNCFDFFSEEEAWFLIIRANNKIITKASKG